MNVCFVTSECVPYVKTGGLADVSGALPKALAEQGCAVKLFLPFYQSISAIDHGFVLAQELEGMAVAIAGRMVPFQVWYGHLPDSEVEVYLIDCPRYFHRPQLYTNDPDEDERFILFQQAVFQVMQRYHWRPDIIHCNDWMTALMPVYLRKTYQWDDLFRHTASVLSLHNMGYQGRFHPSSIYHAGLSSDLYYPGGPYEFFGSFSFLKAGIAFADRLSTVSPTYAREIQQPDQGHGLDGVLRSRSHDLVGILNGIDTTVWNPRTDPLIPHPYDADSLEEKRKNKQALLEKVNLPFDENTPVIGLITRLVSQKGIELIETVMPSLLGQHDVQFVLLGSGENRHETFFRHLAQNHPQQVFTYIGYNEPLAHLIEAGSDLFLMPSHYEPCGLNQMYSLTYGTIPVVRKTGGLADTVFDFHEFDGQGNGFSFEDYTPQALYETLARALTIFQDQPLWQSLMQRGMAMDFSWHGAAQKYLALYQQALDTRQKP